MLNSIKKNCTLFVAIMFFLGCNYCANAQVVNLNEVSDNSLPEANFSKNLFNDSLSSSFLIVVKKEVKPHKHLSHSEHVVVLDGTAELLLGDKKINVKKNDVVFIPKGTIHGVKVTSSQPLKIVSIQSPYFDGTDRIWIEE